MLGCSGQDKNFTFMQSHCFVFSQTNKHMVHINVVMKQEMSIYFRRIYFHNFVSFASPFYRITKDLRMNLKISTAKKKKIHQYVTHTCLWGTNVVVKKLEIYGGVRMPSILQYKHHSIGEKKAKKTDQSIKNSCIWVM